MLLRCPKPSCSNNLIFDDSTTFDEEEELEDEPMDKKEEDIGGEAAVRVDRKEEGGGLGMEAKVTLPEFIVVRLEEQDGYLLEEQLDLGGVQYLAAGFVFANAVHIVAVTKREGVWWECDDHKIRKIDSVKHWDSRPLYPKVRSVLFQRSDKTDPHFTNNKSISALDLEKSLRKTKETAAIPILTFQIDREDGEKKVASLWQGLTSFEG
eukprot:TRINITY_DN2090_c0_g2_i1.p1 TRINITY_DN2090_c0_g2~~TRINITY_DN2090_c0_g2_i1.p1  ORF type:complete len:209 (+),score=45.28 TRINITY_DN2090_c0_g2_i1:1-627(+)